VRHSSAVQGLAFCLLVAGLVYLVVSSADSWGDWVVFAVLLLTALGTALATQHQRWPTRGRPISRSSDQRR
jgi:O-antigen/teichoic acid export membrane protein